ncbi:hypothetical protein FSARC_8729 [Fusarium sarcochroum]|uniref:Uncharacterized protein n=1 Tax=Fusarium sarcochroum TaxID=1208366 RepID=A0A8H4TS93_9HYPO|nr:hypothetical protein FSARC_8729 [Fusarium sarcochroum]
MRWLRLVESIDDSPDETLSWTMLPPKPEAIWFFDLDDREHSRSPFKVFYCDKPGITGYSACMIDGDLVDLHSHVRGEDFSCYRAVPVDGDRLHAVWLYLPVEENERIVEVWRRIRRPYFCRDIPLLRTNKGRVLALGAHHGMYEKEITYERLTSFPKSGPQRFWYSCPQDGIDCFAFDTLDLRCSRQEPRVLNNPNTFVHSGIGDQNFFTTAKLENVVEVTPCKAWGPGTTGIVGLVFLYSDGHRDSVGQVRLDHLMSPIEIDSTHEQHDMWLATRDYHYNGSSGNYFTVVEMMRVMPSFAENINGGNPAEEGLRWMRVRWRGRLDWLFWYRSCRVNFHEEATFEGDIGMALEATGGRVWEEPTIQEVPGYQSMIECV